MCVSTGLCAGRQYHLISEEKNFTEAQSYCREKYTDLATIDSMEDVETLNRTAETAGVSSAPWIGLYKTWGWSLSDTSFHKHGEKEFRGWKPGQPDNKGGDQHCTLMCHDGGWIDYSCANIYQAVCCDICTQLHGDFSFMLTFIKKHQTAEKNIQTQKNSNIKFASMLCVMLPLHSSSLDLFSGLNVTFNLTDDRMIWTEAQSYCREHHTDLASVRNQAENQKVHELIPAGVRYVWIGLFRDSWKWSDGSSSSFRRWLPGQPDNSKGTEACAAADFRSSGRWVDLNCNSRRPFICYGPVSKQVFRLRLRSSVDPNDPAVMEAMLKQFKQKLKAQGVNDDVTLSFRKQADGKAFHKEKRKTRKSGAEVSPGRVAVAGPSVSPVQDEEPFSPESIGSSGNAKLKVRLTRLQLEAKEKENVRKADYELKLQIDSMEDVETLNTTAETAGVSSIAWIGLYDDDVMSWKWSLSDTSFYKHGEEEFRRWNTGQPDNGRGDEDCTVMWSDGGWFDDSCTNPYQAVCCDVRGLDVTFVLTDNSMNWTEAQSYCREHHTDLASVRDLTENQKVQEVIPVRRGVWIGLFRDSWKWSGGSNSSFRRWLSGEPDNSGGKKDCAAADFSSSGRWLNRNCDEKYPFICYGPVTSKQVFRLRLRSSVDPNDPAVMEAMLKQFKQKLKAQGVNDDVTLSFRKQADGKAFHKEKKKTRKVEL
ncbi:C-type mannose receptor 2-like [Centropristis striata]|uniref:C-type mannose receptor 2-like n=1 Tax=Centropristis striata TaxID=184440 RepID=UPI0027E141AB|nr:C-type mannose receptor 2-like [Centropristis striata]